MLSLERMSAGSSAGIGRPIDVVDEGLSREWITPHPCRSELAREEREYAALNQTKRVIVHVFREQARSYRGSHCCCFGNSPCPESVFFIPLQGTILTGLSEQTIGCLEASLQQIEANFQSVTRVH
ncbi:hypothetical protein NHF41_01580 [Pseudomonas proteolytica]|nr:hypothetical protein [Pseudomonas proteolytica]USX00639.1 hypothetical protein NHF41_01580 [Pseudomonas proteolytica]